MKKNMFCTLLVFSALALTSCGGGNTSNGSSAESSSNSVADTVSSSANNSVSNSQTSSTTPSSSSADEIIKSSINGNDYSSLGKLTADHVCNSVFTLVTGMTGDSGTSKTANVDGQSLTITGRMKTGGTGSVSKASIKITAPKAGVLHFFVISSSSSGTGRQWTILNSSGTSVSSLDLTTNTSGVPTSDLGEYSYNIPSAGTYYLTSVKDGLNFYYADFKYSSGDSLPSSGNSSSGDTSSSASSSDSSSSSSSSSSEVIVPVDPVSGSIAIQESSGLSESAYVSWSPLENAVSYKVYYKKVSGESWTQIDDQLIRKYPTYFRADAVGLSAGQYLLKVTPVDKDGEKDNSSSITGNLTVKSYHRDGYAFKNGTSSGAYNMDGSLKDNAVVIYVTNDNINTVTGTLVLDSKGTLYTYVGIQDIFYPLKKGFETRPIAIRFIGNITTLPADGAHSSNAGDFLIEMNGNQSYSAGLTVEGIGNDTVFNGFGARVKGVTNVELRNFGVMNCCSNEGDNIGLQQDNDHVFVHNIDLFYGQAGSAADQVKGDGAMDCKNTNYVTMSYLHFWDSGKSSLLGMKDTEQADYFVTYSHNWFDHSDSRHPRARLYTAHVYNNYFDGNSKYGIGAALSSNVFSENNYFRNCKYPFLTSLQGSDTLDDPTGVGTFSSEAGGFIKSYNDYMTGQSDFRPYNATTNPTEFDAYVASSRDEVIPSTITAKVGGQTYKNNDTNGNQDTVDAIDATEDVPTIVKAEAGRQQKGDFTWTFTTADDTSYAVNEALNAAVTNYTGTLVSVGGQA